MRSYEQSHPWISFRWEPQHLPKAAWLLLGEAATLCTRLNTLALGAKEAELTGYVSLLHGVVANAAMEGNTLVEDHLDRLLEGTLQLPPSQVYLGRELLNLVKAVQWTEARARTGDSDMGPWTLQVMNAQVMKELPSGSGTAPGEFRTVRSGTTDAVPSEDIGYLLEQSAEWLSGPAFFSEHEEERIPYAIIRASMAQLYFHWTTPFAEGNGRTARLLGHQLLLSAGIPAAAAHRLVMHAAATRSEHERQMRQAARPGGDVAPYIAYMARGFAEGLRSLWDEVQRSQAEAIAHAGLAPLVDPDNTEAGRRQIQLAKALIAHSETLQTAQVLRLDPDLTLMYSRLSPKTLQRDLEHLARLHLVVRKGRQVTPLPYPAYPFRSVKS
ncbi:MAG: Fic family protein [Flavobacteriales bacterium]